MHPPGTGEYPELLRLQHIDGALALDRLHFSHAAYRGLLIKFRDNQRDAVAAIRQALCGHDHESAVRLAHTLKGTAGTVGAHTLQDIARHLEAGLVDASADLNQRLEAAARELAAVVAELDHLEGRTPVSSVGSGKVMEADRLRQALLAVRTALAAYDAECEDALLRVIDGIDDISVRRQLGEVVTALRNYRYEHALGLFDDVMVREFPGIGGAL